MFSESADFGGVANEKLPFSHVVQNVFIDVNEERTEASAATASVAAVTTASDPAATTASDPAAATASEAAVTQASVQHHEYFTADRPFMFLIGLREHEIPIFCGRYVGPK